MIKNYFKTAWRSLLKNKTSSLINIGGLTIGLAVAIMIGLWVWDELSFNKYHKNYDRIAQVWQRMSANGEADVNPTVSIPFAAALRESYPNDFKYVVTSFSSDLTVSVNDNKFNQKGNFMEPDAPDMLSLKMEKGTRSGLQDPSSILLSATLAKKLFGEKDPIGQLVTITNLFTAKVTGVYEDIPHNSEFAGVTFIAPWKMFPANWKWMNDLKDEWRASIVQVMVQLSPNADIKKVAEKIKGLKTKHMPEDDVKTDLFLFPMKKWHLYSQFENGVNTGGLISFVWLFGSIGACVLLLACINFMNLSTARSEKRAKEVGIRKAVGSARAQLISQFFCESIVVALCAFAVSLLLIQPFLPWFNSVADKKLHIPWSSALFWMTCIGFSLFTGIIAGSYPAVYLSSFNPVKVLKGTFRAGRFAAVPRKVLVIVQFSISILLATGTIIVFRQIQFAKDRPVGYNREGLLSIRETTPQVYKNYDAIRNELLSSGVAFEMAESQSPVTDIWAGSGGFSWKGKTPDQPDGFNVVGIRHEYGKAVGWQLKEGRDFSKTFATDSNGLVLNEAAVKSMGLQNPVGETISWQGQNYIVIGVIKDMIMTNPYQPVFQTIYHILKEGGNFINIRISPGVSTAVALKKMEAVFKKYNPGAPFEYSFVDEEYAKKFGAEERIGKLSSFFSILAVLISCLGLFGLASFVAEQRTKEIGVRKVLGATVFNVWRLLSKEFVLLVFISLFVAIPVAYYFMHGWLKNYEYRTELSWWIFAAAGCGAIIITLFTVSWQAIKAAIENPVKSLRTE